MMTAVFLLLLPVALNADQWDPGAKITEIVPVDEAFRLGSYVEDDRQVVFWQVLPGYYLYRDRIAIHQDDTAMVLELPPGQLRQDEVFGEVRMLDGLIEVSFPLRPGHTDIQVTYQGCAEQGYCYPPQKRSLNSAKNGLNSPKTNL